MIGCCRALRPCCRCAPLPAAALGRLCGQLVTTILEAILPYQHVIGYKGSISEGIYLERVPNGTVSDYILDSGKPLSLR